MTNTVVLIKRYLCNKYIPNIYVNRLCNVLPCMVVHNKSSFGKNTGFMIKDYTIFRYTHTCSL